MHNYNIRNGKENNLPQALPLTEKLDERVEKKNNDNPMMEDGRWCNDRGRPPPSKDKNNIKR